jgi:hypothetical protein
VAYTLVHHFTGPELRKTVTLRYHGKKPRINVVEPVVWLDHMQLTRLNERRLRISGPKREFLFELTEGSAKLEVGGPETTVFNVFPAIRCLPIYLQITSSEAALSDKITYRIAVVK